MTATYQQFKAAIKAQVKAMEATGLYSVAVEKDVLWNTYLDSFPEGTNLMYKERREYDCTCCKQFIRTIGSLVTIRNGKKVSVWDIKVGGYYQPVIDALASLVHAAPVSDKFYHFEGRVGTDRSIQLLKDGTTLNWDHFHVELPKIVVLHKDKIASTLGEVRTNKETLFRSLNELSLDSGETVLELIGQNSIYRGAEYANLLQTFVRLKKAFDKAEDKDLFCWVESGKLGGVSNIRGTAVGTLLEDLSEGKELEPSVLSFEAKMNPVNYKRPTALVSKRQIELAQQAVADLGLMESLGRRFAVTEDLTINNVLFADRSAKKAMNVFDEMIAGTKDTKPKAMDKVEEISITDFLKNILPNATALEVLVENKLTKNLVSLIAPTCAEAPGLFKWNNGFSWSYNGDIADSDIRKAVAARGGAVDGVFRFSHSWNHEKRNASLMDLHVFLPSATIKAGNGVNDEYGNKERVGWNSRSHHASGGVQDVDYVEQAPAGYVPVENITFPSLDRMKDGVYVCKIHNWQFRQPTQGGFKAEIEFGGQVFQYEYDKPLANKEWITVAEVTLKNGEFSIKHHLPEASSTKDVWGVNTEKFQKVSMVLNSPNHWDGEETGNKHVFFILEGCVNPNTTRGFYNEYLKEELTQHRKVFEVLGSKMKVEESDNQLSGLGFSSTQHKAVYVKVEGTFTRTLKVVF